MAGYEGRDRVVSCIDGVVIAVLPDEGLVAVEDDRGIVFDHGHMDSIAAGVAPGSAVRRGEPIGVVGRKGPSGNFSHLHVGLYLSRADFESGRPCRNLNLYPWILAAYRAAAGDRLTAVARPHRTVLTGETVTFDGSASFADDGGMITVWRWEFPDGTIAEGRTVENAFDRPGAYAVVLRVEDDRGGSDFDVCRVRVYSAARPEDILTTLFFTAHPSGGLRAGQSVRFRGWPQGGETGPIRLSFGDGTPGATCAPYQEVEHRYKKAGMYEVTAAAESNGRPAMTKLKIVVGG